MKRPTKRIAVPLNVKFAEKRAPTSTGFVQSVDLVASIAEAELKLQEVLIIILDALKKLVSQKKAGPSQLTLPTPSEPAPAPAPAPEVIKPAPAPAPVQAPLVTPPVPTPLAVAAASIVVTELTQQKPVTITPKEDLDDLAGLLDEHTAKKLAGLYPPFAADVGRFVFEARKQGMNVGIFCGMRTFEEQKQLYRKGRSLSGTVIDRKQVVTNAPPGLSSHNYGLAVDLVFDADSVKPGYQWSWDSKFPWKKLAELGRKMGLSPAYFWKTFPESPHFENTYGLSYRELLALYNEKGLSGVWAEIDARTSGKKLT